MLNDTAVKEPDIQVFIDPDIFNEVYKDWLFDMSRIQIYFGGASSGKSVFLSQRVVIDLLSGGRNYLICRAVGRTIKRSVFNEVKRRIAEFNVSDLFKINNTEFTITCVNGYQAFFVGLDDVEKIKSIVPEVGVITDIWIEEATEVDKNTVKSLMRRQRGGNENTPKRLVLSFNPIIQEHWIFKEYFIPIMWEDKQTSYHGDRLSILKTWYIHNRFLTDQDRYDLEHEEDKYFFNVYTLGNWGILGNVIFTNWSIEDLSSRLREFINTRNGCDFGFGSAPAAVGRAHFDKRNKIIYIFEELYEKELTNDELATEILNICAKEKIICDSAEPKSIAELRKYGVNAHASKKGKDSVLFGVQWLQGCKIVIDKKCINAQNEFRMYKWKEGDDGKPILRNNKPVPVDANNHFIDQLRYAFEDDMLGIKERRGRSYEG